MSAYANHINVILSSYDHFELVSDTLNDYEAVRKANINREMLIGLQLGMWRSKPMPTSSLSIVGRWTEGSVKMSVIWFDPSLQIDEIASRVVSLVQQWATPKG